ncbi:peptidoglycan-binding protein [Streptomyces sp. NPDC008001]|uniref:peptidoglycan-binding domain-containing protein n=1 Tax=Streptomyces sp. NPDC008001 TaxID=3364804 RepID=UPI0036E6538C
MKPFRMKTAGTLLAAAALTAGALGLAPGAVAAAPAAAPAAAADTARVPGVCQPDQLGTVFCGWDTHETPRTVSFNDTGDAVREAQSLLIFRGFSVGPGGVDGVFGNGTFQATLNFQRAKGLHDDGIIGQNTWFRLRNG